jgi:hypothetical protein
VLLAARETVVGHGEGYLAKWEGRLTGSRESKRYGKRRLGRDKKIKKTVNMNTSLMSNTATGSTYTTVFS